MKDYSGSTMTTMALRRPESSLWWSISSLPSPPQTWKGPTVTEGSSAPCHVSNSWPASGTTNTVISSPEPSLSLGNRQPRSLSTPRDLISRSWAARVYLCNTQYMIITVRCIIHTHTPSYLTTTECKSLYSSTVLMYNFEALCFPGLQFWNETLHSKNKYTFTPPHLYKIFSHFFSSRFWELY